MHCLTYRLELSIKDAFKQDKSFLDLKTEFEDLYRLFKNSGKCWRIFQLVGLELGVKVLCFLRCSGTRFQDHNRNAITFCTITWSAVFLQKTRSPTMVFSHWKWRLVCKGISKSNKIVIYKMRNVIEKSKETGRNDFAISIESST